MEGKPSPKKKPWLETAWPFKDNNRIKSLFESAMAPFYVVRCWIRKLYDWSMSFSGSRQAPAWLGFVSFIESIFFPIPVDFLLIAVTMARPNHWFRLALITTGAGVLGGLSGYAIGYFFFDLVGAPLLAFLGREGATEAYQELVALHGWLIVFGGAFTPIPYKVIALAAGAGAYDIALFCLASFVGRGARFFLVAWLIHRFGEPIRFFVERRFGLVTTLVFLVILVGFLSLRYVFI